MRFVSTDQMARHTYEWYGTLTGYLSSVTCSNITKINTCRFPYIYLWYKALGPTLTEKDKVDFKALRDPDIFHLIQISAIGLQVNSFWLYVGRANRSDST